MKEKQLAEFKCKTIFLSKVAHEFKNPLICISELIDQINDDIKNQYIQDNRISNNSLNAFEQIKSLSNFLLILVRDLNYFSESQIGKSISIEKQETNLEEVINFCRLITESLIQKTNKSQVLKLVTIIDDNVPITIITDHWRLKQVLINLLSNSVKFTLFGKIVLEISLEKINDKEMIKFLIKDTGVGMKEEQQKKLFVPFSKGHNISNEMGSGLGLNIANDIAKKLGGENIKFHSEHERGSSFWFYVDNTPPDEKSINIELIKKSSKQNSKILPDEQEKEDQEQIIIYNPPSIHSSSSITTEQKEFDPSQDKQISKSIIMIREKPIDVEDSSPSKVSLKSPSINCKFHSTQLITSTKPTIHINPIKSDSSKKLTVIDFITSDLSSMRSRSHFINIMVVDDDSMTRQSTIRVLNNISKELDFKVNIIEAEDGVESIYLVYKAYTKGIKISLIFSDETMHFMNGSRSSEIIAEILQKKNINLIPFYLLTAFDNSILENFISPSIKRVLTKPLSKEIARKLIYEKMNAML